MGISEVNDSGQSWEQIKDSTLPQRLEDWDEGTKNEESEGGGEADIAFFQGFACE